MAGVEDFSTEDVCTYIQEQVPDISQSFLEALKEHTDEYLRELASLLGDRIKSKRVIRFALSTKFPVSFFLQLFFTTLIFSFQVKYRYFLSYTTLVHMQATSDATSAQPNSGTPTLPRRNCRRLLDVDLSPGLMSQLGILPYKPQKEYAFMHHACLRCFFAKVRRRPYFPRQLSFQFYSDQCFHYHISPLFQ